MIIKLFFDMAWAVVVSGVGFALVIFGVGVVILGLIKFWEVLTH